VDSKGQEKALDWENAGNVYNDDQPVSLKNLSEMTGFPQDLIMNELLLGDETISMKDLRSRMLVYLDQSFKDHLQ